MNTALVLSPHLDDAAFSCGGVMALLADAGWRVVMATAFTRTVLPPTGFALACQLDKGLPAELDYMALRRDEDRAAAQILGAEPRWLDLPEAPHRGYDSAPALFASVRDDDAVWRPLADHVRALAHELQPALVLGPQGLGDHVDHRQMIRAIRHSGIDAPLAFYRDTPYAIRNPAASPNVTGAGAPSRVAIGAGLARKIAASCAYGSQLGFQFGNAAVAGTTLRAFALSEGEGTAAERFLGHVPTGPGGLSEA